MGFPFFWRKKKKETESAETISRLQVLKALNIALQISFDKMFILDRDFTLPMETEVLAQVKTFEASKYVAESHDCDNFALEMWAHMSGKGWPFGTLAYSNKLQGHMLNCFICKPGDLRVLEPQTGEILDLPADSVISYIQMG